MAWPSRCASLCLPPTRRVPRWEHRPSGTPPPGDRPQRAGPPARCAAGVQWDRSLCLRLPVGPVALTSRGFLSDPGASWAAASPACYPLSPAQQALPGDPCPVTGPVPSLRPVTGASPQNLGAPPGWLPAGSPDLAGSLASSEDSTGPSTSPFQPWRPPEPRTARDIWGAHHSRPPGGDADQQLAEMT